MLKYILFISVILKLALSESDNDEELATVELNMETFSDLSAYIDTYDDEISAEMVKTCKQIKKKKACLNAFSKAPVGINTGRRGNDSPGECMYFHRRNNKVVKALGNQCLPANEVKNYVQANGRIESVQGEDEDDDADAVEMSEGLFDKISSNAPSQGDIDEEMIKYCKQIKKENACLRSTTKAPVGRTTNRRGNDGPGECMYFQRRNNPVVQTLGNQCLPPAAVIHYKQGIPAVQALVAESDDDDEELATVELNMETFSQLSPYIDTYNDEISAEVLKVCKGVVGRRPCLNAFSKAPVGITTGRRGNDGPGECMYFKRPNNKIVKALGSQCLPANEVKNYVQANGRVDSVKGEDEEDDADAVEMSEGLFDRISANAPSQGDIDEEMVKYCKQIRKENVCLRSTTMAPVGRTTNRRGNDGPGECMYFQRKNNPVVQNLGNQCLPPAAVINYKQNMPPFQALVAESEKEDDEDDIDSVEISMQTWNTLSLYINQDDLSSDARIIVGCKKIKSKKACLFKGVTRNYPNGIDADRRGNYQPGECMYFNKPSGNPIVQALGSRCLAPKAVIQYHKSQQNPPPQDQVAEYDDGLDSLEIDSIEMSEGLFDVLSKYAPDEDDMELINADGFGPVVGCKNIPRKIVCINKGYTPNAPNGIDTGRRYNDGPGQCMFINKRNNPIVLALGSRCLAPKAVITYKRSMQNPPLIDPEDDSEGLPAVELTMNTLYDLAPYITDYDDEISAEMVKTCKQIKKKRACLNAYSKAPVGIATHRRGSESHGECMYFNRRNNKVAVALGNQCLPPLEVKHYVQMNGPDQGKEELEDDEDEENDSVEMSEGLFDVISENAPATSSDDVDQDAIMKYCKQIKTERVCLRATSRAPVGRTTNRRGNDGPGECMYFKRKNNPVVQTLGNRCLAPQSVINYKQMPPPPMEHEFFAALGLIDEESQEINYSALSMVFVMMAIIVFTAYYKLCKSDNTKYEAINSNNNNGVYRYQSV